MVPEVEALGGGLELGTLEAGHIPWDSGSTGLDEGVMTLEKKLLLIHFCVLGFIFEVTFQFIILIYHSQRK